MSRFICKKARLMVIPEPAAPPAAGLALLLLVRTGLGDGLKCRSAGAASGEKQKIVTPRKPAMLIFPKCLNFL